MALINCPECGKQVSDAASTCPNCGVAIASAKESKAAGASLTTIQETSKKLKLHTLVSVVAIIIGIGVVVLMVQMDGGGEAVVFPILLIVFGIGWYFITRLRIWWHHK